MIFFDTTLKRVSKSVLYAAKFGKALSPKLSNEIANIRLCKEFGWTYDYAESLDLITKAKIFGYLDAIEKERKAQANLQAQKQKAKSRRR